MTSPQNSPATASSVTQHREAARPVLRFAVVTLSDTRTLAEDRSGQLLVDSMSSGGHTLVARRIIRDELAEIQSVVTELCALPDLDVLLLTGGTGVSPRDQTPEAVAPLLEMTLPGFGELFRMLSYAEIGPAAMLSRALAGRIGQVLVFCLPGSTNAVRLAAEKLLLPELPHLVHHARG
jgi:molybdopterin adenylyltransferase